MYDIHVKRRDGHSDDFPKWLLFCGWLGIWGGSIYAIVAMSIEINYYNVKNIELDWTRKFCSIRGIPEHKETSSCVGDCHCQYYRNYNGANFSRKCQAVSDGLVKVTDNGKQCIVPSGNEGKFTCVVGDCSPNREWGTCDTPEDGGYPSSVEPLRTPKDESMPLGVSPLQSGGKSIMNGGWVGGITVRYPRDQCYDSYKYTVVFVGDDDPGKSWESGWLTWTRDDYHTCGFQNISAIPWTGRKSGEPWIKNNDSIIPCWVPTEHLKSRDYYGYPKCTNKNCYRLLDPADVIGKPTLEEKWGYILLYILCIPCFVCTSMFVFFPSIYLDREEKKKNKTSRSVKKTPVAVVQNTVELESVKVVVN